MPFLKDLFFFSVVKYHLFQTVPPIPFFWVLFPDWLSSPLYTDMLTCPLLLCSCRLLLCLYFFTCFPTCWRWILCSWFLAFYLSSAPSYCLTPCCTCWLFTVNWLLSSMELLALSRLRRREAARGKRTYQDSQPVLTHMDLFPERWPLHQDTIKMTMKDGGWDFPMPFNLESRCLGCLLLFLIGSSTSPKSIWTHRDGGRVSCRFSWTLEGGMDNISF